MSESQTYYIYNPFMPLSEAEKRVMAAGYPFVSTTVLGEQGRLNEHCHHSKNTHLVVAGSIAVGKSKDDVALFRGNIAGPGSWVELPRKVDYIGEAGPDGCVFVEGHEVLSPTSAQRFTYRGTIIPVPETTKGAFTTGDPNMPAKSYYAYSDNKTLSPTDISLINAGFRFVSTFAMAPGSRMTQQYQWGENACLRICSGSMAISKVQNGVLIVTHVKQSPGNIMVMSEDVEYIGEAGPDGCVYIEAHTALSSATAERFQASGSIVRVPRGTEGAFTTAD